MQAPFTLFDEYLTRLELREIDHFVKNGRKIPDLLPYEGSEEAELLKRMERLAYMGCNLDDLEFAVSQICRFFPARYEDVTRLVLGEVKLNVRE
jgi:hypothetical protein